MTRVSVSVARKRFNELVDRVYRNKQSIVLTRYGQAIAVIAPIEDWGLFEYLKKQKKGPREEATPWAKAKT